MSSSGPLPYFESGSQSAHIHIKSILQMPMIPEILIAKAIDHYSRTGEIQDALIPFFTQNGRWFGNRRNWRKSISKRAAVVMAKAFLPSYRRTALNVQGEPILLTSFRWRRRRPVTIPWFEVRGAVSINSLKSIKAPNLRSVAGDFYSYTNSSVCLPNLTWVGGDFDLHGTRELHAPALAEIGGSLMVFEPDLPSLRAVGKRFWVHWARDLRLPCLRHVGGSFEVNGAASVFVPALEWVGFSLRLCYLTTVFSAPRLKAVGGSLEAGSARVFHAARLESVGGELYTESAPDYYRPDFDGSLDWVMHPDARARWRARECVRRALRALPSMDI
jgi:hypothetical protein